MRLRICCLALALLILPTDVQAAGYFVRSGDSLSLIAARYHVSVAALARANGITNPNLVQAGRYLAIPGGGSATGGRMTYRVRWGDTLLGIAARYHVSIAALRSMNPRLGAYLLAGQRLTVCGACAGGASSAHAGGGGGGAYRVRPGDTLSAIAGRYGVSVSSLMSANGLANPNLVRIGARLTIPGGSAALPSSGYAPWSVRSLIVSYASWYGLEAALPLAVGFEESGFNQAAISRTGAIGVMQVEPYTGARISQLQGRLLNLYNVNDNIRAGVYWLSVLVQYYGGNERLAVAAYYEGSRALARHGMYRDTVQYVANVMALKYRFGG